MLALLAPLLNSIFGQAFTSIVAAYQAKLTSENTTEQISANLAARELAVQQTEIQAQNQLRIAEVGHFWEPDKLFEYTLWLFFSKVIIWDKLLGWGTTDPLTGAVGDWSGLIIMFLFGKRGIENVARILKR